MNAYRVCGLADFLSHDHFIQHCTLLLATSELRKRPGKSEVDNASWDCFRGRKQKRNVIIFRVSVQDQGQCLGLVFRIRVQDQGQFPFSTNHLSLIESTTSSVTQPTKGPSHRIIRLWDGPFVGMAQKQSRDQMHYCQRRYLINAAFLA